MLGVLTLPKSAINFSDSCGEISPTILTVVSGARMYTPLRAEADALQAIEKIEMIEMRRTLIAFISSP